MGITQSHPRSLYLHNLRARSLHLPRPRPWQQPQSRPLAVMRYVISHIENVYGHNGMLCLTFIESDALMCLCISVLLAAQRSHFLWLLQDDGSVTAVAEATAIAVAKCYELPPYCRPPPPPPSPSPPSPPPPSPSPPPSPYYHYGSQGSGYGKSGSGYAYNNNAYTEEVSANLN